MALHVVLYKLTDQGIRDLKHAPERIREGIKRAEGLGIKVHGFSATCGEYDYVAVGEGPSEEVGIAMQLAQAMQRNVRTTILRALTVDEFEMILAKIP
jgi:uncharacterized protein with GYD domain